MNELDWKQPALFGGLIAGLLSVIPGVQLANCCFCAWLLVGGGVAAKMLINRTPRPVKSGEGAKVGAMAGLIASGIYLVITILVTLSAFGADFQRDILERIRESVNNPDFQETLQKLIEASVNQTPAQRLISSLPGWIVFAVLYVGFSTLGGLLGVALFEKRRDQPPPPQYPSGYPPNYPPQSGGPGGGPDAWPQA
ncbi:MAG TPA: hypothetical protein VJ810_18550 [Blastocatellia bacterium]|nr:hypothetical protein [Blastocatellia bacterium]